MDQHKVHTLSLFVIMRNGYDHMSFFVSLFDILMGFDDLLQRIRPIDDGFHGFLLRHIGKKIYVNEGNVKYSRSRGKDE